MSGDLTPPKVTREMVRGVMDSPPYWLAGSYIPAWKAGSIPTASIAYAVTAALGHSPYDDELVDEVTGYLERLGYGDGVAAVWV